jgi:hypothetical protein
MFMTPETTVHLPFYCPSHPHLGSVYLAGMPNLLALVSASARLTAYHNIFVTVGPCKHLSFVD